MVTEEKESPADPVSRVDGWPHRDKNVQRSLIRPFIVSHTCYASLPHPQEEKWNWGYRRWSRTMEEPSTEPACRVVVVMNHREPNIYRVRLPYILIVGSTSRNSNTGVRVRTKASRVIVGYYTKGNGVRNLGCEGNT